MSDSMNLCGRIGLLVMTLTSLVCFNASAQVTEGWSARKGLLEGVESIGRPGVPGPLTVFGPRAEVVVAGSREGRLEAVVAAAQWGRGRVVAYGHGGYFSASTLRRGDSGRFLQNAVRWCAGERREGSTITVLVVAAEDVARFLSEPPTMLTVRTSSARDFESIDRDVDVLIVDASHYQSPEKRRAIADFIKRGGGLVTASLGWGYLQVNPGKNLVDDHPGNLLLTEAGLAWADGYLDATHSNGYEVVHDLPDEMNARIAFERLTSGDLADTKKLGHASQIVMQAARVLPDQDQFLQPRLRSFLNQRRSVAVPTEDAPLRERDALDRLRVSLEVDAWKRSPMMRYAAHPAAEVFPGAVPESAPRVRHHVIVDPTVPEWCSTGVYAVPGEFLTVRVPDAMVAKGYRLRIGAHKDLLWHHSAWKRVPDVTVSVPIDTSPVRLASPFGGLVYIEVPRNVRGAPFEVVIENAVSAPYFVTGETSIEAWTTELRHAPAPWAELRARNIVLTVPSAVVRDLENPQELLDAWDRVLDACADLAAIPRDRRRPERIVPDVQISAGYMHSGYPIMTHLDVREAMVDVDLVLQRREGSMWGFFHELGHNHQKSDWTFDGTVEVTCNLFSLYVLEKVGNQPISSGHGAVSPDQRQRRALKYFNEGPSFETWKRDPFLALEMYIQLREAFGWEPFIQVFAEYESLERSERPSTDDEKRDQWLVRFSRAIGQNLGPFFEAWNVPTSSGARASLESLPVWMPSGFPPKIRESSPQE